MYVAGRTWCWVSFSINLDFSYWGKVSHLNPECLVWLVHLSSLPWTSPASASCMLALQVGHDACLPFTWVLGNLNVFLHGKCFVMESPSGSVFDFLKKSFQCFSTASVLFCVPSSSAHMTHQPLKANTLSSSFSFESATPVDSYRWGRVAPCDLLLAADGVNILSLLARHLPFLN